MDRSLIFYIQKDPNIKSEKLKTFIAQIYDIKKPLNIASKQETISESEHSKTSHNKVKNFLTIKKNEIDIKEEELMLLQNKIMQVTASKHILNEFKTPSFRNLRKAF